MSGVKKSAFKEYIDLNHFKKYAKLNGCTLNEYATALMSQSFHDYFKKYSKVNGKTYPIPDSILFCMPFSLREPVDDLKDIKMTNDISGTVLELPIRSDIKTAMKDFKVSIKNCIASLEPFTLRKHLMIAAMLPYTLANNLVYFMSSKVTMLFTNLNASKVPYKWAGKEAKSIFIQA